MHVSPNDMRVRGIRIPLDICMHIFNYVSSPQDKLSLMLVNNAFLKVGIQGNIDNLNRFIFVEYWSELKSNSIVIWIRIHSILCNTKSKINYTGLIKTLNVSNCPSLAIQSQSIFTGKLYDE